MRDRFLIQCNKGIERATTDSSDAANYGGQPTLMAAATYGGQPTLMAAVRSTLRPVH